MARYKELLAEKERLEKLITEARQHQAASALKKVRETLAEFGFTPEDVFGKRRKDAGRPVAAKYRNLRLTIRGAGAAAPRDGSRIRTSNTFASPNDCGR